jgi:Holliday junction resolvase
MVYKNDDFDDFEFEDVIGNAENAKKKKKNSGDKGHRGERNLGKLLKKRFGFDFVRTIGSGNRWSQVVFLPKFASNVYSGDLICPENFKFVVECKDGYGEIDLHVCFERGLKKLDEWMQQATDEHLRCGRFPIICWKKDYKPWLAMIRKEDLGKAEFKYLLNYKDWCIMALCKLLDLNDGFFFKTNGKKNEATKTTD